MSPLPKFEIPPLELKTIRQAELPFSGSLAAGAYETLAGGGVAYPFRVIKVKMIFSDYADNLVEHRWYIGEQSDLPTTAWPSGFNLFAREGAARGFRGKAVVREVPTNIEFEEPGMIIRLATYNGTNYMYYYNCSITIQEISN